MEARFEASDIHCTHCAKRVTEAIGSVDPTASVVIDVDTKTIDVREFRDLDVIQQAIRDAGYTPRRITE